MEHDDLTGQPDTPRCEWCGIPLTGVRRGSTYCSRAHKNTARRARKRQREQVDTLRDRYPLADVSLTELDDRRREHRAARDPGEDLHEFSDYGELPGDQDGSYPVSDYDHGGQADDQTARVHALLRQDAARRVPRRPWAALKQAYSANPGVELADITEERAERHQAQQSAVKARLRSSTTQPQDRHNPVTRDAVATRANGSRRLNRVYATADPRPPAQRQEFAFEAEQVTGSFYRGGRAQGQQSRHSGYAWNMDDGFRY
jgi:hypothetical protein